jgi:hypothetical protein
MGLKQVLSALKLVELDSPASGAARPAKAPAPPAPRMEQILADLPEAPEIDPGALPPAASASGEIAIPTFAEIYRAAAIDDPAHGFSAGKVLEMLQAPGLAGLDVKAKAAALAGFLEMNPSGPIAIADVIRDAVRRDQALDKFEELLRSKLGEMAARVERDNAALQAELDELQRRHRARMEESRRALDVQRQRLDAWVEAKRAEEARLAEAVAPFVEGNPISR